VAVLDSPSTRAGLEWAVFGAAALGFFVRFGVIATVRLPSGLQPMVSEGRDKNGLPPAFTSHSVTRFYESVVVVFTLTASQTGEIALLYGVTAPGVFACYATMPNPHDTRRGA
jgi:hypothetical protein